jgi:diacylglycerol kinase family enzyme
VVVNGRASGVGDPLRAASDLVTSLRGRGRTAAGLVTGSERELHAVLRLAAARGRRVVLVGGDGSLHAAANAPLRRLPELALVPAGRANNIARALGIPVEREAAVAAAASAPARPLDALLVQTPERRLYAVEGVSAGFHAAARSTYTGTNSADLRAGVRALAGAVSAYAPYRLVARLDGRPVESRQAAQLFVANLPFFGFGFKVDPLAAGDDGRLAAIVIDAPGRATLLRALAATYRGAHLGRAGVRRIAGARAELVEPLPLVADAVPLGTTTASVTVAPARLHVARPLPGTKGTA